MVRRKAERGRKKVRKRLSANCANNRELGTVWEETASLFGGGSDTENHGVRHGEAQRKKIEGGTAALFRRKINAKGAKTKNAKNANDR